jgi:hypothetical protein
MPAKLIRIVICPDAAAAPAQLLRLRVGGIAGVICRLRSAESKDASLR